MFLSSSSVSSADAPSLTRGFRSGAARLGRTGRTAYFELLSLLRSLLENQKDRSIAPYVPLPHNHFVREHLNYVPNDVFYEGITRSLHKRGTSHRSHRYENKLLNHLTAVVGSPGSGKSVGLLNYPSSAQYQTYVAERRLCKTNSMRVSSDEPIVCLVTFRSWDGGMDVGSPAFGLRIIYSALRSMQLISAGHPLFKWGTFCSHYESRIDLTAMQAVALLQAAYGRDRLMFIVVDELAKTRGGADKRVSREINEVLNSHDRVDVVLTARTPAYAHDLMSGTLRHIEYIIPPTLDGLVPEYAPLAEALLSRAANEGYALKPDIQKIIRAAPLFAGGHPRALARLVQHAASGELWRDLESRRWANLHRIHRISFLYLISGADAFRRDLPAPTRDEARELALAMGSFNETAYDPRDRLFRAMLEDMTGILSCTPEKEQF